MKSFEEDYPFKFILSFKPLIDFLNDRLAHACTAKFSLITVLNEMLAQAPELLKPIEDMSILEHHSEAARVLMSFLFPPTIWETDAVAAMVPFAMKPFHFSPSFHDQMMASDGSFRGRFTVDPELAATGRAIRAYICILKKCYGVTQHFDYPIIRVIPDLTTGLDRYYKVNLNLQFVDVVNLGGPSELSPQQLQTVLENLTNPAALKKILPPEKFQFQGLTVAQLVDVTESEVISVLERALIEQESILAYDGFLRVQQNLRTLFRRPALVAGLCALRDDQVILLNVGCEKSPSCILTESTFGSIDQLRGSVFELALQRKEIISVPDLLEYNSNAPADKGVVDSGFRSIAVTPLFYQADCIGTLVLKSPLPGDMGLLAAVLLKQVQPIFAAALKRALDEMSNHLQSIIKEYCTAIHPTVEWRFRKAAFNHLECSRRGRSHDFEPIVFKDVYPLFAQSDIRGSSGARNLAIQQDLAEHMNISLTVLETADKAKSLPILRELAGRVTAQLNRTSIGLSSGDEVSVVKFIRREVEPLFPLLRQFGPATAAAIDAYDSAIDPNMGTVYRQRKEFESGVSLLNDRLSAYLDVEEAEVQAIFPHYFERRRTDGLDYLIYIGESLQERGGFHPIFLKNLRLWQLYVACGITWHTAQLRPSLMIPLDICHLILIENSPLAIRFRFDEKRFDVDGAYDIRYEIVRSRLDKAVVKGGEERLTQPDKITVVYSRPDEASEIRRHIDFLQTEGFLLDNLEVLEVGELPGVQGLKALRVGVNLDSPALAKRADKNLG
ncbi:MAG: GAF domain-containing protein [Deltaproteobacteria bacterium]|nr:GAF domain-containing protein [Deltaproteobacteria bacterium]